MAKVKIVLDADVLIHFSKAGRLSLLPNILPEYEYTVLSVVYDEIKTFPTPGFKASAPGSGVNNPACGICRRSLRGGSCS